VTNQLLKIQIGDSLMIREVFGAISYKGEGIFIAGGAGVTPFVSILRHLASSGELGNNKLIFANKTRYDIILNIEFQEMLRSRFVNILSEDPSAGYAHHGFISEKFLKAYIKDSNTKVYLCGPEPMMASVEAQLTNLNVDTNSIIKENFE
jgi:ferredoxin-NADP reductase